MTFDKSNVFTALNADELEVGSTVVVADTIAVLEKKVTDKDVPVRLLGLILPPTEQKRFCTVGGDKYALAYLIKDPQSLKWTDLKLGDAVKQGMMSTLVIAIDEHSVTDKHIFLGSEGWITDERLKDWELIDSANGEKEVEKTEE